MCIRDSSRNCSITPPNIGGHGNGNKDDENNEQNPWTPVHTPNSGQENMYACDNEICLEVDLTFRSLNDLNKHVKRFHKCIYEDCNFSNMNNQILKQHMKTHKEATSLKCNICNMIFNKRSTLDHHITNLHSPHLIKEEDDNPDEQEQKTLMLTKASQNSKTSIPTTFPKKVKFLEVKLNTMKQAPKVNTKDILVEPINFNTTNPDKVVRIPRDRIAELPKFEPMEGNPISNYIQIETLIAEMLHLKTQFNLNEPSFVRFLLYQYSDRSLSLIHI